MPFFVFYIFLSVLIMVQCQEFQHKETGPHNYTEINDCRAVRQLFRISRENASLMPRERHVVLIPPPGYEFNPRTVPAKRCNGYCPDRWFPMPTKTNPIHKIVHIRREGNPMNETCVSVEVMEHLNCKCKCMQSEENCKPSQDWISASCSCQCKDRENLKRECTRQYGMEWYDDDCYCACTQKIMECRSGQKWDRAICGCVSL